jgi:hypothetical protein
MEPCGHPWIANLPFFVVVFEASNVPWKMKTEKNDTINYTVENTLLLRI